MNLDRLITQFQETGEFSTAGLSVADLVEICDALAINPAHTRIAGGYARLVTP